MSFTNWWCGRRDLNPHALRRQILNLVRLPIPPRPHRSRVCRSIARPERAFLYHREIRRQSKNRSDRPFLTGLRPSIYAWRAMRLAHGSYAYIALHKLQFPSYILTKWTTHTAVRHIEGLKP